MTRSDKWKKRPSVERYRAFKDACVYHGVHIPEGGSRVTFFIEMPRTWSGKKKAATNGTPHQQKIDVDNLAKGIFDAIYKEDCAIWDIRITKRWGYEPGILVECDE